MRSIGSAPLSLPPRLLWLTFGLLLGLTASSASAQVASLVADFAPGAGNASSYVNRFERVGERLVLVGATSQYGFTLYGTDGTSLGTEPLGADCGEECDLLFNEEFDPLPRFVGAGERLYWSQPNRRSDDCQGFRRLWATDATPAGTYPLTDCAVSVISFLVPFQDRLVFATSDDPNAFDRAEVLWITDGTPGGTTRLLPGDGTTFSGVAGFTVFQGRLFVLGADPVQGSGLWVSDGTNAGTRLVRTLPGAGGLDTRSGLVATSTHLFFQASSAGQGQVWASDGTATGTRQVSAFANGGGLHRRVATAIGNRLFFLASLDDTTGAELWQSDGTVAGTRAVSSFRRRQPFGEGFEEYSPYWILELGGNVVFMARDDPQDDAEFGLWRLGPTPQANAELVSGCGSFGVTCFPWRPQALENRLYLIRGVLSSTQTLWVTNGTQAGTRPVATPCPAGDCRVRNLAIGSSTVYMCVESNRRPGGLLELWRLDNSAAGASRIAALGPPSSVRGPLALGELDGQLLVPAWDERHGNEPRWLRPDGRFELLSDLVRQAPGSLPEILGSVGAHTLLRPGSTSNGPGLLWATDGRSLQALATEIPKPDCTSGPCAVRSENGLLYFTQTDSMGTWNLWRTDATPAGTFPLTGFQGPFDPLRRRLTAVFGAREGRLYFLVDGVSILGEPERGLWATDGTALDTLPVRNLTSLPSQGIGPVTDLGDLFYFVGTDGEQGRELWRSDLTDAGTFPVTEFDDFFALEETLTLQRLGGLTLFFKERDFLELWATDGSNGGTARVVGFPADTRARFGSSWLTQAGGSLFFSARTGDGEEGLWRTDGTEVGTRLVASFPTDTSASFAPPPPLVASGDTLFFLGRDEAHGAELWTSDGTPEGTRLVRDLLPGTASSRISSLVAAGSRVFFMADDGIHGAELWVSDGTAPGTRLVHDLHPGPVGSRLDPSLGLVTGPLAVVNDRLYLLADDGLTGTELWSLPLAPSGPACADAPNGLCLQGNRFRAEAAWRDFHGNSGVGTPVSLTADTGYFWFFDPANVELITKQLDGRTLNEHFWTFYGALSNVEYHLTLTDTETGLTRRFFNPPGLLASVADTESFGPRGAALERFSAPAPAEAAPASWAATSFAPRAASGTCTPSASTLCLADGRFAVSASWRDFQGNQGAGQTRPITGDTGAFWFFAQENLEVVLKVLDGTPLNGKFWVFYGALSNVEYELVVTDTTTGLSKTYRNPAGRLASEADTSAF